MVGGKQNPNLKTGLQKTTGNCSLLVPTEQGILLPVCEDASGGVKRHSHRTDQADTVCPEFQTALEIKLPRHKRKSPLVN